MNRSLETVHAPAETAGKRTSLQEIQEQFDRAAMRLRLKGGGSQLLRSPMREHRVAVPVRMDDGSTRIVQSIRVQHNDARGPFREAFAFIRPQTSTMCAHWRCS